MWLQRCSHTTDCRSTAETQKSLSPMPTGRLELPPFRERHAYAAGPDQRATKCGVLGFGWTRQSPTHSRGTWSITQTIIHGHTPDSTPLSLRARVAFDPDMHITGGDQAYVEAKTIATKPARLCLEVSRACKTCIDETDAYHPRRLRPLSLYTVKLVSSRAEPRSGYHFHLAKKGFPAR